MQNVLIHMKPSALNDVKALNLKYHLIDDELNVIVPDVDYKNGNHPEMFGLWQDPDEQLVEHYGLDWDQVNCVEAI